MKMGHVSEHGGMLVKMGHAGEDGGHVGEDGDMLVKMGTCMLVKMGACW